jgi:hypothetical protein
MVVQRKEVLWLLAFESGRDRWGRAPHDNGSGTRSRGRRRRERCRLLARASGASAPF